MLLLILFWISQTWPVTLRIQELVFSGCIVPPVSKETKFGNSDQEASPSAGKNTEIILTPCCAWKCVPKAFSGGVKIVLLLLLMCGAVFYFFLEIAWNDLPRNTNQNFLDCKITEFKKTIFQKYLVKYRIASKVQQHYIYLPSCDNLCHVFFFSLFSFLAYSAFLSSLYSLFYLFFL